MDWATLFKDYPAVITAIAGVIGTVLGFFLGRWNSVENRNFIRRAVVYDMRIQEAREVLEKFSMIISLIKEVARVYEEQDDLEQALDLLKFHDDEMSKIPVMMHEAIRNRASIDLLNDAELILLRDLLIDKLIPPFRQMMSLKKLDRSQYSKKIDKNVHEIKECIGELSERTKAGEIINEDEIPEYVEVLVPTRDVTEGVDLAQVQKDFSNTEEIITRMKARIDKLAQTVK